MTAPARPEYLEIADYLGPLRRRWLTIALLVVIGVALGAGYYEVSPRAYTSDVLLQVNPLPQSANSVGGKTQGGVNPDSEAQLVQSYKVAKIAAAGAWNTGRVLPDALRKDISVLVPPNTNDLQISCTMAHKPLAYACANAVGAAYLQNRYQTISAEVTTEIKAYQAHANKLLTGDPGLSYSAKPGFGSLEYLRKLTFTAKSQAKFANQVEIASLTAQVNALLGKINPLTLLSASLQALHNTQLGLVVTPASMPTAPSSPRKLVDLPGGLALGLVIGLPLAYYLDRRRPRVHAARDIERRLDVPTLVSLTERSAVSGNSTVPPRSEAGQAFAELAQYVAHSLGDGNHVVLVAATSDGPGGSVTAANLAAALARTRADTIVICADLRRSRVPQLLSVTETRGFAELIAGTATVTEVVRGTPDAERLGVITAGADIASVLYTLDFDTARQLLAEMHRQVRYIVIEVRSGDTDGTFGLAEFADAAIIAAEVGASELSGVADCVSRLDRMRTPVLGAVVLPGGKRPAARPLGDDSRRPRRRQPAPPEPEMQRPRGDRSGQTDSSRTVSVTPPNAATLRPVASAKPRTAPADEADGGGTASRASGTERNGGFPAANRPYGEPPPDFDSVIPGLRQPADSWQPASGQTRSASEPASYGPADPVTGG